MITREILAVARQVIAEETSLDGMTKEVAKGKVNKLLGNYTKGLFRDDHWAPVQSIWTALTAGAIDWTLVNTQYRNNEKGQPASKEWKFEVSFINKRGRPDKLYGVVVAAGCGSIGSPMDKYDLVAYCS